MSTFPTLPAEEVPTDIELSFVESSPTGLWPENQDSNIGQVRKVFCDVLQEDGADELTELYFEMFICTASTYLSLWEEELGASIEPAGMSIESRRAILATKMQWGAFTRPRRNAIIEKFIQATLGGESARLTPAGLPLVADGIQLWGELSDISLAYRVDEDIEDFSFVIYIVSSITPSIDAMTREMNMILPAGLSFTVDNTQATLY
jgi:hypothetical protein